MKKQEIIQREHSQDRRKVPESQVHTHAHIVICVTFGDIFKMKHFQCMLERGLVKAVVSLKLQWQLTRKA